MDRIVFVSRGPAANHADANMRLVDYAKRTGATGPRSLLRIVP